MATRPRIFVTQPVAESALARLRAVASVKVNPDDSRIIPRTALIAIQVGARSHTPEFVMTSR